MKTARKKTANGNEQAFNEETNLQPSGAVLSVVKDQTTQPEEQEEQQPAAQQEEKPAAQEPEAKAEVKTLTIAEKLAALKELDRIAQQRGNLIIMMDNLNDFVIAQNDAAELDEDKYKTCVLIIKDDLGNEFITKNTILISATVSNLLGKGEIRLSELDSLLVFPAA